jgi:hypothetical protein
MAIFIPVLLVVGSGVVVNYIWDREKEEITKVTAETAEELSQVIGGI